MKALGLPLAVGLFLSSSFAVAADKPTADFGKWWSQFQTAVARRDARAVSKGVQFPIGWENGPKIREIRDLSDLMANFELFFTPDIKKIVATKKPEKLPNGNYLLVWEARGNEYSMGFTPLGDSYALAYLGEGPPR